jgi:hypothetical protein
VNRAKGQEASLEGKDICLILIDPWDLVSDVGSGPFRAHVIQDEPSGKFLLLELKVPFLYNAIDCRYFVAQVRHEDTDLSALIAGSTVACNLTRIPPERVGQRGTNFDLSWWRGGLRAVADLRRA